MLGDVYKGHCQISGRVQDGKAWRAYQNNVTRSAYAVLPKHEGPGQERNCEHYRYACVQQSQLFKIPEAAPPRGHFPRNGAVDATMLAPQPAKRPDQRNIGDDV